MNSNKNKLYVNKVRVPAARADINVIKMTNPDIGAKTKNIKKVATATLRAYDKSYVFTKLLKVQIKHGQLLRILPAD